MGKRLTDEERAYRALSEKQFQTQVVNLARENGWLVAHFHDSRKMVVRPDGSRFMVGDKDARGFPDLCLVRGNRALFWELKKELGKTTEYQDEWLERLRMCGLEARVVRPSDFESYVIPMVAEGRLDP